MTTTSPAPARPGQHDPRENDLSLGQLFHRLYALFYNKRFGLLLILAMGLLTLFGVLFVQAPDAVREDPAAYSTWLEQLRPRYGGWTSVLSALGMFTMFDSIGFMVVTVLLALSIIACTTHRLPQLWRQATRPHLHVREAFFDRARSHGTAHVDAEPEVAYEQVGALLKRRGFRVVVDPDSAHGCYADRFRFAPLGTVVAHVAFVIILAGVLVTGTFGYRNDDFVVPVGQTVEVGNGSGLSVEATRFVDAYDPQGRPTDYYSDLVLRHHGQQVEARQVRVNTPLRWGGYSFNQASFGVAAVVEIRDANGATRRETVPLNRTTDDQQTSYGELDLAAQGLEAYVISAASGATGSRLKPGQMMVEVYDRGQQKPTASKLLEQGRPVEVAGLTMTFVREQQYTGLMVVRDPGAPLVWIGSLLIMVGMCATMFLRHHRIWVRVDAAADGGSRVRLASPDRHDSVFERRFAELVATVGTPVTTSTTTTVNEEQSDA